MKASEPVGPSRPAFIHQAGDDGDQLLTVKARSFFQDGGFGSFALGFREDMENRFFFR